jgi:hypothetical protein
MNIIHTDTDCIWLQDITPLIDNNNYNIIAQIEYGSPNDITDKYNFIMCCGFFKLNYSVKTLELLENIMSTKIYDDQVLFNYYIFKNTSIIITNNNSNYLKSIYLNNNTSIGILKDNICTRIYNKYNNLYIYHPWLHPRNINEKKKLLKTLLTIIV